jgi:signal peptidase I
MLALVALLVALLAAAAMQAFLLQVLHIRSESMQPTVRAGDRVLVDKLTLRRRAPRRGEVVVLRGPGSEAGRGVGGALRSLGEGLGMAPAGEPGALITRVVGLPGELVETRDGVVFVDGEPLSEPYAQLDERDVAPADVPPGHYWVLGDNRSHADDSRRSLGTVPREALVGRALTVMWPPSRISQELHTEPEPAVRAERGLPRSEPVDMLACRCPPRPTGTEAGRVIARAALGAAPIRAAQTVPAAEAHDEAHRPRRCGEPARRRPRLPGR